MSGLNALDTSKIDKDCDGSGGSLIRSGDEVFLDAIANFSDGGLDSTSDVVIINTEYPEISGSSENNCKLQID